MYGQGTPYLGNVNTSHAISPVALSGEWPTLGRLIFVVLCSCLGSIFNGFFISSFFVDRTLKRVGNAFLGCACLSDAFITAGVMAVSAVVILSGEWDVLPVCQALQFLTTASTYCYNIFFTLVAGESYFRLCWKPVDYRKFMSMNIRVVCCLIFIVGFVVAAVGTYLDLDYDYCQRLHFGNHYFRVTTFVIFHVIPSLITTYGLLAAAMKIHRRATEQLYYKRSHHYTRDFSMTNLNIAAFVIYILAWTPYLIIVHEYPETSDKKFYHCLWIALSRSLFTSALYFTLNRNFRRAFIHLFYYCCLKSSLSSSLNNRHRRALEYRPATGDVRVHIMHQTRHVGSPLRGANARETQEL